MTPSTRKTAYKRMKHTELGTDSSERVLKVKTPSFMAQARKFIAGGATYTQDIQNRFYYGTDQVFQSQLLIT